MAAYSPLAGGIAEVDCLAESERLGGPTWTGDDRSIFIRTTAEDMDRLDVLAKRIPVVTRSAIARAAMRIGLAAIERDPAVLLESPPPKRGGARRRPKPKGK